MIINILAWAIVINSLTAILGTAYLTGVVATKNKNKYGSSEIKVAFLIIMFYIINLMFFWWAIERLL